MPQNIEIKARIDNPSKLHKIAAKITDQPVEIIRQEDIFFHCKTGRLKLRIFSATSGQLIFYQRGDQSRPKTSTYAISKTSEPAQLHQLLKSAYGEKITVRKIRYLYIAGRTRIHIDAVEELGDFLELEVVLSDNDNYDAGVDEANRLMSVLGIAPNDLVQVAYADLLAQKA